MKKLNQICICVVLAALMTFAACSRTPAGPTEQTDAQQTDAQQTDAQQADASDATLSPNDETLQLADGLTITEVFSYSGPFVEDGSNEQCANICAVRLQNDSAEHYQYLKFKLKTAGGDYTFTASTLFSGARMTVLNDTKAAYTDGAPLSVELQMLVPFNETPTVHTDTLKITYTDGFINVENLTDTALSNVYVYFKNMDDYGYLGGITYRTRFDLISPGETVQKGASNMHKETSRVVFATYGS